MDRANPLRPARPPIQVVRLALGLPQMLGSASGGGLLVLEGLSPRATVIIGITYLLAAASALWSGARGTRVR